MAGWVHDPWIWLGAALVLLLLELAAPGYVLLSFSLGAFVMALGIFALGWAGTDPASLGGLLPYLLAWMLASGVAAAAIWRFRPGRAHGAGRDEDVNDFENH